MNSRHRTTAGLTLGFLTLGAQAAPMDVIAGAAAAGFGAAGLRISGRMPGDAWPSVDADPAAFGRIRDAAGASGVRISSISGYYITPQTQGDHLLANVRAARELGAPLIAQGCFEPDRERSVALIRDIGLLVDSLHLARSGAGANEVAALAPGSIYLTQLCDGPRELGANSSLFDEAMSGRMHLGDGALDLAGLVRALSPEAEIELETPVVADAGLESTQRACRAADKAVAFFQRHFPSD